MCTVTFLPLTQNNFILTSSRDEQPTRKTHPPKMYEENGVKMYYPKDKVAGGTWIGTSSKNRLICVLNGAFTKHKRKENYTKSRGIIAKELLQTESIKNYVTSCNLEGVEPFTMVIIDWNKNELKVHELVWNEHQKHFNSLKNEPKIWSSSTLYTHEIKEVRNDLFKNWISKNEFSSENILDFHHSEIGDKEQTILMKRSYVETISITSVKKTTNCIEMHYEDLVLQQISKLTF